MQNEIESTTSRSIDTATGLTSLERREAAMTTETTDKTPFELYQEGRFDEALKADEKAPKANKLDPYFRVLVTLEADGGISKLTAALKAYDNAIEKCNAATLTPANEAVIKAAREAVAAQANPIVARFQLSYTKAMGAAAAVTAFVAPFMSSMLLMDNSNTTSNSTTGLDSIAPVASAVILAAGTAAVGVAYNNNLWARRTPEEPIRLSREGAQAVLSRLEDLPAPSHS